jgi:hypothetical protein
MVHIGGLDSFGIKEKCRIFVGFESYRKFSYGVLWNKGLNPYNSYEIPIEYSIACSIEILEDF